MPGWGDKVFKRCNGHGGSEACHYTKTGQRLKVFLMERMYEETFAERSIDAQTARKRHMALTRAK